jgi:Mn-containing catalase
MVEQAPITFSAKEDKNKFQITFTGNIREILNFLKDEEAVSSNTYDKCLEELSKLKNEKSTELNISSSTEQSSTLPNLSNEYTSFRI